MESLLLEIRQEEKDAVLKNFPQNINDWCELVSKSKNIPEEKMCQVVIQVFGKDVSKSWIRECVAEKYKISYKASNAKQKTDTISTKWEKFKKYAKQFGVEIVDVVHETSSPMFEATVILKDDETNEKKTK